MAVVAHAPTPSAQEQRRIIESLEGQEESLHVYCVTKRWYEQWQNFVGLNPEGKPVESARPGPLDMDREVEDNNMYVDQKIWIKWVYWYGVSAYHELDRRNWASDEKEFEVCILSPYSGIVENPTKTFDMSEEAGYIETQLKKIFQVPSHRKSRLWACEKTRHARFQLLLDRSKEICFQDPIDHKREYILAIEVSNLDGSWPSHIPGDPKGGLDKYAPLAEGPKASGYWEQELAHTVETVFGGISTELTETVSGIVHTTKCISSSKERDLDQAVEKLEAKTRGVDEVQKSLNKKAKELFQQEDLLKAEIRKVKREKEHADQEKKKFQDEVKKMEDLNKLTDTKVKLNVGGHAYMTSTLTLNKDSDSMLAVMFSGRHSLKLEDDGSYFIDRDGTHFRYLLNFLRDGGFREGTLPQERGFLNELLTEAEYYQIHALIKLIRDKLRRAGGDEGASEDDDRAPSGGHKKTPPNKRPHRKLAVLK